MTRRGGGRRGRGRRSGASRGRGRARGRARARVRDADRFRQRVAGTRPSGASRTSVLPLPPLPTGAGLRHSTLPFAEVRHDEDYDTGTLDSYVFSPRAGQDTFTEGVDDVELPMAHTRRLSVTLSNKVPGEGVNSGTSCSLCTSAPNSFQVGLGTACGAVLGRKMPSKSLCVRLVVGVSMPQDWSSPASKIPPMRPPMVTLRAPCFKIFGNTARLS